MAGRKKNPEVKTAQVSVSLPKYIIDALKDRDEAHSAVVREALITYLDLKPPITYLDQMPKKKRK